MQITYSGPFYHNRPGIRLIIVFLIVNAITVSHENPISYRRCRQLLEIVPRLPQNLNMTWSTGAAQLDAEKMTHLLVTTVSTEPEEGLHVGTWPPSPLPSCSQMSLSSPKLQVLSPASLSVLNEALGEKEGKPEWAEKKRGAGCKTGHCVIG